MGKKLQSNLRRYCGGNRGKSQRRTKEMVKKTLQNVVELEENGVSVIRTIAVREKSYWKGKCLFSQCMGCGRVCKAFI